MKSFNSMKKKITNFLLAAALVGCIVWAAAAPKMQALIPTILAVILGIVIVDYNTDYVRNC